MTTGAMLIAAERRRQIDAEGWTPEHDDRHGNGGLFHAATCYLRAEGPDAPMSNLWPWDRKWWKPKDRLSNLVRAGAMLVAERDRLSRKRLGTGGRWPQSVEVEFMVDGIAVAIDRLVASAEEGE